MKRILILFSTCLLIFSGSNAQELAKDTVAKIIEVRPEFKGGDENLYKYIKKNIKYPKKAKKNDIQGQVYVSFVVEKDGSINEIAIKKGVHELLDQEAMRIVQNMPAWSPGNQNGKPIRVQFVLPIIFKLN